MPYNRFANFPAFPEQPQPGQKACDVCGKAAMRGHSLLLSTTQVVRNEFYWRLARDQIQKMTGSATEEDVLTQLQVSAKDTAAWLVCTECGDSMRGMQGLARAPWFVLGELPLQEYNQGYEAANKWWDSGAASTPVFGAYRPSPGLLGQKDVLVDYPNGMVATRLGLASRPPTAKTTPSKGRPQTGGCAIIVFVFVLAVLTPAVYCLIS